MWAGIAQAVSGQRLGDVSHAIESRSVRSGDYGLIREYTGHGIGTEMHMDPMVRNYGPPGQGLRLRAGMALAIEPMITRGGRHVDELDDGWTVITRDGSRAAHFEHTVAITPEGPWVLTAREEEKAGSSGHPERVRLTLQRSASSPSPTAATMPGDPRLRASDADRERTAELLREHHAVGRLTAEEFDDRLEKVVRRPGPSRSSTRCSPTCPRSTCISCRRRASARTGAAARACGSAAVTRCCRRRTCPGSPGRPGARCSWPSG